MLFAQEGGILVNTVSVLGILAGAGVVITFLFRALITSKDRELAAEKEKFQLMLDSKDREAIEREGVKKSWQEIAVEAQQTAISTANFYREKDGKPPLIIVAPVLPETHSPATKEQRERAAIATIRATIANVRLAVGLEPRSLVDDDK